jgi:hypothetical protein
MIAMQRSVADIIRLSLAVDAKFHAYFHISYTNSSNIDMQGTMYVKALMINLYDLNSSAKATGYQWAEVAG